MLGGRRNRTGPSNRPCPCRSRCNSRTAPAACKALQAACKSLCGARLGVWSQRRRMLRAETPAWLRPFRCRSQTEEQVMNWDQIEGNWKQFKGNMKERWGRLTDDDFARA